MTGEVTKPVSWEEFVKLKESRHGISRSTVYRKLWRYWHGVK